MPRSRPSSTARHDRVGPEALAHVVERGVERTGAPALERQQQLVVAVLEVAEGDAHQRQALGLDQRRGGGEQGAGGGEDRLRLAGRLRERVRAGGAREVVEAQAQDDGATDPPALAQPAAQAVDQPDERRVDRRPRLRPPADRALRPDRAPPHADPHPPRIAVVGEGVELAPGGAAEQRDELVLVQPRGLRDGRDPVGVQLARGDRADAPQPLDRQRVQEGELLAGGHLEQAVGLRHGARHLGQVLGGGDPDGDRQAHLVEHPLLEPDRDLTRRARDPPHAADVEERLVDRQALHQRRRVAEDVEHRLARLRVGLEAARDHHRVRAQRQRPPPAHRRLHPASLRLVAGRQHHPAAHDHRPPAQPRIVPLLDRRVERVEVRVQDVGLP